MRWPRELSDQGLLSIRGPSTLGCAAKEDSLTNPDRLALRREPDRSFVLLGAITADTKEQVTVRAADGRVETYPRRGLTFVAFGSLNHFALLDPEGLRRAFDAAPRAVLEQALVDSTKGQSVGEIKQRLTQAGVASAAVDKAWDAHRKAIDAIADVKVAGQGSARKFSWTGERHTRLGDYVGLGFVEAPTDSISEEVSDQDQPPLATAEANVPDSASHVDPLELDASAPSQFEASAGDEEAGGGGIEDPDIDDPLLKALHNLLGDDAPKALEDIEHSAVRIGSALSGTSGKELKLLSGVPEDQRHLVALVLLARKQEVRLWPEQSAALDPTKASGAIQAAIGEASRSPLGKGVLARFVVRVLQRTELDEVALPLVANAFARAASAEEGKPSTELLELAGVLADRTKAAVGRDWEQADSLVAGIALGMNRVPLDEDGPRSRFMAALFEMRSRLLNGDLLWKHTDPDIDRLAALDRAAGGVMRRALLDPVLGERIVKPEVERFMSECRTRHDLGRLVALRGSFAQYVDARDMIAAMGRVAKHDPKANEWFQGLRQQDRVDSAASERDTAAQEAARANTRAHEAERRTEQALADRDAGKADLLRASEANAEASDAQLRQAKLDVLRSLTSLAVTIKGSAAALDDPALLQRLAFALRREGLTEIASSGETVTYDPARHDAQGEHIDPGTPVTVGRSGYTYHSGDESLVLVKAHVSAI